MLRVSPMHTSDTQVSTVPRLLYTSTDLDRPIVRHTRVSPYSLIAQSTGSFSNAVTYASK